MSSEIKISTCISPFTRYGSAKNVVNVLKESGFSSFDFTMMFPILGFDLFFESDDYVKKAHEFKHYIDSIGIKCNQTHGFTPCFCKRATKKVNNHYFENVKRSIEITHILGANYCVLHPMSDCSIKENVIFFDSIKNIAIKNDVVIAIENTISDIKFGNPYDFLALFDELDDDVFKMCLDIGHSEVENTHSSAVDFIKKLSDKIVCLHIHDNDKFKDLHQLPFTHSINLLEIFNCLKEYDYKGDITFECLECFNNLPVSLLKYSLKFLYDIGIYLKSLLEE